LRLSSCRSYKPPSRFGCRSEEAARSIAVPAEAGPAQPRVHQGTGVASWAVRRLCGLRRGSTASAPDSTTCSPRDDPPPTTWCEPPAPPREGSRQSSLPLAVCASDGTRTRDIRRDKAGVLGLGRGAHADPLSAGKGSRSRQPGQQKLPLSGGFPGQLVDQPLSQTCRKTTRDVAVRRAYRRCVRNVSACSADRQQQSADLQALY
jgi:hypothetical protein